MDQSFPSADKRSWDESGGEPSAFVFDQRHLQHADGPGSDTGSGFVPLSACDSDEFGPYSSSPGPAEGGSDLEPGEGGQSTAKRRKRPGKKERNMELQEKNRHAQRRFRERQKVSIRGTDLEFHTAQRAPVVSFFVGKRNTLAYEPLCIWILTCGLSRCVGLASDYAGTR